MTREEREERIARWRSARSRGAIKQLAKEIDSAGEQRMLLEELVRQQEPDVDTDVPTKKLLRLFLNRSEEAQIRKNPIHRNEAFTCVHCFSDIPKSRSKIRDHCPLCLRGVHLDNIPGDRASTCRSKLVPSGFQLDHGVVIIQYRCEGCEHRYQVKAHPDDQIPHSLTIVDLPK